MHWLPLVALLFGPATPPEAPPADPITRQTGFTSVVINHLNRTLGTENLPSANGGPVDPGVFVTLTMSGMQIFDFDVVPLHDGVVPDPAPAPECASGCPAAFFDLFQYHWLKLAVESATMGVELPTVVAFGADPKLPVRTLLQVAYAAAESRPITPPTFSLFVNSPRQGLRAIPLFLIPPRGLELPQGSAALAFTIEAGPDGFVMSASSPDFSSPRRTRDLRNVESFAHAVKKKFPGKETVIIEPKEGFTIGELVRLITLLREEFPRVVLSAGQDVLV